MKALFASYRKTILSLCSPALFFFALFLVIASFFLGFFYTDADAAITADPFEEQKKEIEAALTRARWEYEALTDSDDLAQPRQKILFYETALRFSLPIWSGDFYFESASLYARITREWEILNTYQTKENTPRRRHLEELDKALSAILEEQDVAAYLSFYRSFLVQEDGKTQKEAEDEIKEISLRFYATRDGTLSPAESSLISEITLIEQSLDAGVDLYHPYRQGKSLSQKDSAKFLSLYNFRFHQLKTGTFDPVPANTETLYFSERVLFFFVLVFLLSLASKKGRDGFGEKPVQHLSLLILSLGSVLFFLLILSALALFVSTLFFAPGSLFPYPVLFLKKVIPVPFFPALLLRLLCRGFSAFLPILICLFLSGKQKKRGHVFFLSLATVAAYSLVSFFARLSLGSSTVLFFLPFIHLDLVSAFLPSYPFYLPRSTVPPLSLALFLCLCAALFALTAKDAQKKREIQE